MVPGSANPAHKKRQKPAASIPAEPAIDQILPCSAPSDRLLTARTLADHILNQTNARGVRAEVTASLAQIGLGGLVRAGRGANVGSDKRKLRLLVFCLINLLKISVAG